MNDNHSLSHSSWRCKYHIVFAPKYQRQVIYREIEADIGKIIRMLCERKGVTILAAEACPDHIHLLAEIPPHINVTDLQAQKSAADLLEGNGSALLQF